MRGRQCIQKLLDRSNSSQIEYEKQQQSLSEQEHVCQVIATTTTHELEKRRSGVRFTSEEDNCIRLGIGKFGLRWSTILRNPEYNFNACRVPNTLRKRAEALKLV